MMLLQKPVINLKSEKSQSSNYTWDWRFWQDLPYLTCSLLDDWKHGFFTRSFAGIMPENLSKILSPNADVYRLKQIHGNIVFTTTEIKANQTDNLLEGDAIVNTGKNESIWVCSADCNPVLIGDSATGKVAAIHAGWRGTAIKIIPETIKRLLAQGSQLENLKIAIGPAISGEVYQVDEEVAIKVCNSISSSHTIAGIINSLSDFSQIPILPDEIPGKVRLDVRKVNEIQLYQLGLTSDQIAISPHCTFLQSQYFFSYRRSQEKQIQWSGIINN
ncbi:MAG TPA: peptidoglycan editing factor PgeF [Allocoleopsis sp.]